MKVYFLVRTSFFLKLLYEKLTHAVKKGGCQLNNDTISFQLPLTWNLAKSAIVRSTISRVEGVDKLMTSRHLCAIRLHERKTAMP